MPFFALCLDPGQRALDPGLQDKNKYSLVGKEIYLTFYEDTAVETYLGCGRSVTENGDSNVAVLGDMEKQTKVVLWCHPGDEGSH